MFTTKLFNYSMATPLVTVLMPVYNTDRYLQQAMDSVLNQSFSDFEFLIIDDGSTDKSLDIIKSFKDKRIRLVRNEENIKLIATLNKGIDISLGKYICRADADDICFPTRIEKQFNFMEENPDYAACSSGVEIFYENSETRFNIIYKKETDDIRIRTLYQNHFVHPSSFIRKDFINERNLRFNKHFIHSEDYYFFVKLSEIGKLYNVDEVLVSVRKHLNNVSVLNSDVQDRNSINVIKYQLKKIGIDPDAIDYELYFRFFYASFDLSRTEINSIEKLLLDMLEANALSHYLPHQKLTDFLCNKWLHLCLNSAYHGLWIYEKYLHSPLSKYIKAGIYRKNKFFIKSFLKYQKK